jgi:hypothetical protein
MFEEVRPDELKKMSLDEVEKMILYEVEKISLDKVEKISLDKVEKISRYCSSKSSMPPVMQKFNCTHQLHESIVIKLMCKCECRTHRESVLLKINFKCLN